MKANGNTPFSSAPGISGQADAAREMKLNMSSAENRTVSLYRARGEQEASGEITLPDYIANAEKILFAKAVPALSESSVGGGTVDYRGTVTFTVFFITADGELKSVSFDGDVDGNVSPGIPENTEEGTAGTDVELLCEPVSCRLMGPRRISAKCRTTADICVTVESQNRPTVAGDRAAAEDGITLQRKSDMTDALCAVRFTEEDIRFSDDIELDNTMPPVAEIIRVSVKVIPDEFKQTSDGIQLRATALMSILYNTENGELVSMQKRLPLSEIFDTPEELDGMTDISCRARAQVSSATAEVAENSFGERKVIELDFVYSVDACCMCDRPTMLTRDIYSTEYKTDAEYRTVQVCRLGKVIQTNFSVNARDDFESVAAQARADRSEDGADDNSISPAVPMRLPRAPTILFADAEIKSLSADFDEQKSRITVSGTAEVYMIVNDEGTIRGISFTVPIKNELDGYGIGGRVIPTASAACQAVHGRADTSSVYADFEVMLTVTAYAETDEELIDKLILDKSAAVDPSSQPPILIYYPHKGESLWSIAKRYSTTVAALREANHLQGDVSPDDGVMLIPRHRKAKTDKKSV